MFNHKYLDEKTIKGLQKKIHCDFYESGNFMDRVENSCSKDIRYVKAFNDYFEFLGKDIRVDSREGAMV